MRQIRQDNKDSKDELMNEIIKLKEKIEVINLELAKDSQRLDYIKGICRFEESLPDGFYEVTVTANYIIERKIKNVKVAM
jgi:hypothetical protein